MFKLNNLFKSRRKNAPGPVSADYPPEIRKPMTPADFEALEKKINFRHLNSKKNLDLLCHFDLKSREEFALRTKSPVIYFPDEVALVKRNEETAAMLAAPRTFDPSALNGLNIGCGDRRINPHLTPVDIMRSGDKSASGSHHAFLPDAILANPDDLPFKPESIDFIVALHMLEHVPDPVAILKHWASVLKPGGGIGLILPDYKYTWDARKDPSKFGHKWNSDADTFRMLHAAHLADDLRIEAIGTLEHRISFDVVLRKPGNFTPFSISNKTTELSGAELFANGKMITK
ncbi:Methyltransferase domain-containing protein [Roseibium suaedae]|uniref:Methyltransferase domain-containing protein n=2 Tax=Roseibium suaedae TaxID=735517 RepID=A0A1M7P7H1_9HYPH|nr:Methyltransferase domain-containing protein [Roseibium suaedae]